MPKSGEMMFLRAASQFNLRDKAHGKAYDLIKLNKSITCRGNFDTKAYLAGLQGQHQVAEATTKLKNSFPPKSYDDWLKFVVAVN